MTTAGFTEARLTEDRFLESNGDQPVEFWAPPLAPTGTSDPRGILLREEALGPAISAEHRLQLSEQSVLPAAETGFSPGRKLIVAATMAAALGAGALVYLLLARAAEKPSTRTADAATAVQTSSPALAEPPSRIPQSSGAALTAVAWPDLPSFLTAEALPEVTGAVTPVNTTTRQTPVASQKRDFVFVQRAGVSIRSAPAANGAVLATAPKGARFKVTKREGEWLQVESGQLKGWVRSQFLAPRGPRSENIRVQAQPRRVF